MVYVGWFVLVVLVAGVTIGVLYRYHRAPLAVSPTLSSVTTEVLPAQPLAWPSYGQAAVATKEYGVVATNGTTAPQPTASTAKLITALAVMDKRPFSDKRGETIMFTPADVALYQAYVSGRGSVTPVTAGLEWTQYQALQAILLDSANNVSDSLAIWAFGSLEQYREYAQAMVEGFGLTQTTIGLDASGYSATTTSTAHDLALLAAKVLAEPTLRSIVGQSQATLPGAGAITNTNYLLTNHDIIGMKTGYIPEAGGVFVLAGRQASDEHTHEIITVVMGAPGGASRVAQDAAYELYQSAKANFAYRVVVTKGQQVGTYHPAWSGAEIPLLASENVGMFVWGGTQPEIRVSAEDALPGKGGTIGTVVARIGSWSTSVPLVINEPPAEPSWWWRVVQRG